MPSHKQLAAPTALLVISGGIPPLVEASPQPNPAPAVQSASPAVMKVPFAEVAVLNPIHGGIRFLKGEDLTAGLAQDSAFRVWQAEGRSAAIAMAYLKSIAAEFKLRDPEAELREESVTRDELGMAHAVFNQIYCDIPVWGAHIRVHLSSTSQVTSVEASTIPTPVGLDVEATWPQDRALAQAASSVQAADCARCQVELVIWPGETGRDPRLAYSIFVPKSLRKKWRVFIDAKTGALLEKTPTTATQ